MVLDKRTYDECKVLLNEMKYDELEGRLDALNETMIVNYVHDYLENNGDKIKTDLRNSTRFKTVFKAAIDNRLSYQIGSFNAILSIFEILAYKEYKKDSFIKRIKALSSKKNINKILLFLYKNPDSQHKIISEAVGLRKNYVSELLRELEDSECVDRYTLGKRSFYTLSKEANEFLMEESKKDAIDYKFKSIGYLKYDFAENSQKYSGIRAYKQI